MITNPCHLCAGLLLVLTLAATRGESSVESQREQTRPSPTRDGPSADSGRPRVIMSSDFPPIGVVKAGIWDVKNTRGEAELKAFIRKLRVFLIAYQDATHGWLMDLGG